jgi:hypothetical protein
MIFPLKTPAAPQSLPNLVAFWDFQEDSPQLRLSRGASTCALEVHGVVERVEGGVFGAYAAHFTGAGHLCAPREQSPELCIGGVGAQVSLVAWLRREKRPDAACCEFVAGVWNEHSLRQYGMFLDLRIHDSFQQFGTHVSRDGGPTRGFKYCMEAAIGQTPVPFDEWACAASTYDGAIARTYLNGVLDERGDRNPFAYEGPLFDGGRDGSDFNVGATPRPISIDSDGVEHGSVIANPFYGVLGGLALYSRA